MGLLDAVVGATTGFIGSLGNPAIAFASGIQADKQARARKKAKRIANEQIAQEREFMADFSDFGRSPSLLERNLTATTPKLGESDSGGNFFSTVRSGLREFGGFVSDAFSSGIPQLLGLQRPRGVGQQPAITTVTNLGAQESQGSGSIQAGMGALLPNVLGGARSLLKSPLGQLALGTGTGVALSGVGNQRSGMRITRKMKSQARTVVNLAQGNLSVAADILNISEDMLVMILLKRFRNDGPVVTKAALRKTKSTIRKLHNMQDVLKSITPTAAGRRRAPMKRATTTTLIKN